MYVLNVTTLTSPGWIILITISFIFLNKHEIFYNEKGETIFNFDWTKIPVKYSLIRFPLILQM